MKRYWVRSLYWLIETTLGYRVRRGPIPEEATSPEKKEPEEYWTRAEYVLRAEENQKLCPLCLQHPDWPYDRHGDTNSVIHQRDGMHHTMGLTTGPTPSPVAGTWKPMKGHGDWDQHVKCKKLGLIDAL